MGHSFLGIFPGVQSQIQRCNLWNKIQKFFLNSAVFFYVATKKESPRSQIGLYMYFWGARPYDMTNGAVKNSDKPRHDQFGGEKATNVWERITVS